MNIALRIYFTPSLRSVNTFTSPFRCTHDQARWFAVKRKAYRKELTNALKLWQKSGYLAESREIIRARAANRVSGKSWSRNMAVWQLLVQIYFPVIWSIVLCEAASFLSSPAFTVLIVYWALPGFQNIYFWMMCVDPFNELKCWEMTWYYLSQSSWAFSGDSHRCASGLIIPKRGAHFPPRAEENTSAKSSSR